MANNAGPHRELDCWGGGHLYQSRINKGFAQGLKRIMRASDAPNLLIINPDVRLLSPMMERMCVFMDAHKRMGPLGARIVHEGWGSQGSARAFLKFSTVFFEKSPVLRGLLPNTQWFRCHVLDHLLCHGTSFCPMDWIAGVYVFFRRRAFGEGGGLDERAFFSTRGTSNGAGECGAKTGQYFMGEGALAHKAGSDGPHNALGALVASH